MFIRQIATVILIATSLIYAPSVEAAEASLDQVIDGIESFYQGKDSLQVTFRQTVRKKYQPAGVDGAVRTGVAFFQKPGKMRWDYRTPEPVFYVSDGNVLWVYEAAENVAYKGNVKGSQLFGAMKFLFGAGSLKEEFAVRLGEENDREREVILKSKAGESAYRSIRLFVDAKTSEIRKTVVVDPLGDRSEIVFEKIKYAPISNAEWFNWTPADDVRVEDLSKRGK